MALAGSAVGAALTKLKATLEGDVQGEVVLEKDAADLEHHAHQKDKSMTHHYKATRTQTDTYEINDSVDEAKLSADDKKIEKSRSKRSGCFGWCFGRKG